ncbi:hypothetical protein PQX77_010196 [Marasmius sp. AFHP31]|nr:hypothetical protein PQX77_010196 [Marasmius sp. AFHP31]
MVFCTLTNTPIAVAQNDWSSSNTSLTGQKLMENGWTRFRLNRHAKEYFLEVALNNYATEAWMSQALSIFHASGISLEEDLSVYTTADFAEHLGFDINLFRPLDNSDRFQVMNDDCLEICKNQEEDVSIGAYNSHDPTTNAEFEKTLDSTMLKLWTNYKDRYVLIEDIVVPKYTEEGVPDNEFMNSSSEPTRIDSHEARETQESSLSIRAENPYNPTIHGECNLTSTYQSY